MFEIIVAITKLSLFSFIGSKTNFMQIYILLREKEKQHKYSKYLSMSKLKHNVCEHYQVKQSKNFN